jgi:hypothetical protein
VVVAGVVAAGVAAADGGKSSEGGTVSRSEAVATAVCEEHGLTASDRATLTQDPNEARQRAWEFNYERENHDSLD